MIRLRARPAEIALVAGTGVAALLAFLLVKDTLVDDAYITLGYARNLALHLHWGLIPDEVSNTATSPLNVWNVWSRWNGLGHIRLIALAPGPRRDGS